MINKKQFIFILHLALVGIMALGLAVQAQPVQAQEPTTYGITLNVVSARTEPNATVGPVTVGDTISEFEFLINVDNTGDPFNEAGCDRSDPDYPDNCDLPSIRTVPGWAPIAFQGDQNTAISLPAGKYLVSVQADGFKMDGEHFTVPDDDGIVEVQMHPFPLPPATMVIKVFEDNTMTNGQFDTPSEQGLAGFRAAIHDIAGEITTDIFGNPLCGGSGCYSDADGLITIPNIGPLRYDVLIFPPEGESWIQTTTLEGSQGWDTWLQENGTGLDNEFLIAAEPFPWTMFGFVKPNIASLGGTGSITGVVMAASTWVPATGGLPFLGDTFAGFMGTKMHRPITKPWLALNSLQAGDTAVWVGQGNADGSFTIPNVPEGNYFLTYWDENQHYILDFVQVTVTAGQVSDVGIRTLTGWFTEISGTVFQDLNLNGRRDDGEPGLSDYLVVLKDRDNTEIDRMSIAALTDPSGFYELEKGYPMGSWMVLEAYSDLFRTTGVTYKTLNMKNEVTLQDAIVDFGILPILGQPIRVDWGVAPYGPDENGGIAGTVFYDTMRAEDEARYAGAEPFQPGIPDLTVNLYKAVLDAEGNLVHDTDGSALKGAWVASTVTETFARPKGCSALDVDGNPVDFPSIPLASAGKDCLEGPLMGTQGGDGQNNLDGNWGFGEICDGSLTTVPYGECLGEWVPMPPGHYLVEVVIPNDGSGNPMFQVTREEDLNMFDGDEFLPAIPPPACAGELHTVDVANSGTDNYPEQTWMEGDTTIVVPASTPVENPGYVDAGGSRYEGQAMPLCDVKHVYLQNGKAVAPIFNLFTDVPIPGKWKGYIIDNLNVSVDPNTLFFGEMAGVPNAPIGLYDYNGRLVHTVHSDFNGVYEVLLPSTGTFNAPSPSGMFANVYYLYGNDPGPIGRPNQNYNPQYRSIGASFEIYPGNIMPSDLAPTQNGAAIWAPGIQNNALALCKVEDVQPQLFAVSTPYGPAGTGVTIQGRGFGDMAGVLSLGGVPVTTTAWSDTQIDFSVPAEVVPGPQQLLIEAANGLATVNGLTFHVIGKDYAPIVFEVGPGRAFDPASYDTTLGGPGAIQAAIDAAAVTKDDALVVVFPGIPVPMVNPLGMYIENPIIYAPVKLQGVGPGGILPDGTGVFGSIIDGRGVGGDSPYNLWWRETFLPDLWLNRGGWDAVAFDVDGNPIVYEGAVITVLSENDEFKDKFAPAIDGFIIQGGDQQGFPNNVNPIGGGQIPGAAANVVVQGGGIFVDRNGDYLQISNNVIQTNGGAYGGAIRLGTPNAGDNDGDGIRILHNRILANGGTNLAGAIAVFNGAEGYEIAYNDICGNSSIEYGGGISHYGYSPGGEIHHNKIYFNSSYDEGGGIMIAGELPPDPAIMSEGAGAVDIYNNLIQSNLANDDGGGLRFLMAGLEQFNVFNNIIANNVSTHEGGGISLNDVPFVTIASNTIMNNVTTATAMTSNGLPAPAGLSSSRNSLLMQKELKGKYPAFSNPVQFNNLFWDNRAGSWDGNAITGIGAAGDPSPIYNWDLGVADGSGLLSPQFSLLQTTQGTLPSGSNLVGMDPLVVEEYETVVAFMPWRGNTNFVGAHITVLNLPITLIGDYHLQAGSPAIDVGAGSITVGKNTFFAPAWDYDDETRPSGSTFDIGADELTP